MSDLFGVKGRTWLRELELPLEEAETLQSALRHIEFLDGEIAAVDRLIAREALASAHAAPVDDRARRERDLRGDVFGRGRRHPGDGRPARAGSRAPGGLSGAGFTLQA